MVMEPTNQSFRELLGNGVKYLVPRFQRDYAWDQEQWEDLWADIASLDLEKFHYMGYIVTQRKKSNEFEVIDGQQRLVTLSLVVLAAMSQIKKLIENEDNTNENQVRLDELSRQYIGSKNTVTLKIDNKLTLNRNNDSYYRQITSELTPPSQRGTSTTNKLIGKAFNFFLQKINNVSGKGIAQFIQTLSDGMIFTRIAVDGSVNAYKVFETLNARGVQLSTPDLLKNFLFSLIAEQTFVSDHDLDDLDIDWAVIVSQLGSVSFTEFVRHHYNAEYKLTTKNNLFKQIRLKITTAEQAVQYIRSLKYFAPIYYSLLNAHDDWWNEQEDFENYKRSIKYLDGLKLFGIKQPLSVFLSAFDKFNASEFLKTTKYIYNLSIRYNVICHLSPNEQEQNYNKIANKVSSGEFTRASHIKNSLEFKSLYPDDSKFKNSFKYHKMPSKLSSKKIRFILCEIETYLGNNKDYLTTVLEHVSPQNPDENWVDSFGEGTFDSIDRLGNMIVLDVDNLGIQNFDVKKEAYKCSGYKLALKISEYSEWDLQNLNSYQSWLSDQAMKVWNVDVFAK